ncbi:DUF6443 domain-containing protein [Nodularia spumigena CS-584]|nr:DUF6443 domain-containing protein [Nodularia spumigena CS-584]
MNTTTKTTNTTMKLLYILLLLPSVVLGQSQSQNYIKTSVYRDPTTISNPQLATSTVTYYDGLGRPLQIIAAHAGGNSEDNITPVLYDPFGREVKKYLPLAKNGTAEYHPNGTLLDSIHNQYALKFPGDAPISGIGNPYTQTVFEPSPLARVLEQAAPGKNWSLDQAHTAKYEYSTNVAEEVRYFFVTFNATPLYQLPILNYGGHYSPGKLYKTVVKNENWTAPDLNNNTTHEFKNLDGHLVLKRNFDNGNSYDTYYVYDRYGNLTYVIPPLASDRLLNENGPENVITMNGTVVNSLCYQYHYDTRNRLIAKKIPDMGWEYIIYDKLDRPIITHNAKMNSNVWAFTKYDVLGRVAYTGLWTDTRPNPLDRIGVQGEVNNNTLLYESRSSVAVIPNQGADINYTSDVFPTQNLSVNTVNYYDDYNFSHPGVTLPDTNTFSDALATPADERNLKGLPTGSLVRALTTNSWTYLMTGYDAKGRVIWGGQRNNYLGYTQNSHSKVDLTGQVTETLTEHTSGSQPTQLVRDYYTYDNQGRLLRQTQKINQQAEQLIAYNHYDEFGQLDEKKVGRANPGTSYTALNELQKIKYHYNIRGWLTDINEIAGTGLFAFKVAYDQPEAGTALYSGNIAATRWKTSDGVLRGYNYQYDALNRLKDANYTGGTTLEANPDAQENYSEGAITYDKNGNIMSLTRFGLRVAQNDIQPIDILTYTYYADSNKLLAVTDASTVPDGFNNGDSGNANDYGYDNNGNMITDLNKGITSVIRYNHLNLSRVVTFASGNIEYIYDALGTKLRKRITYINGNRQTTITTDYAGGFVYVNGGLRHFAHAEGYVAYEQGTNTFNYIYQYKDHLGNNRVSYTEVNGSPEVVDENHYYAFGLKHQGYGPGQTGLGNGHAENYKYNGKELNEELGLNWYDYGARNYEAAIGRWMNVDPLAETSRRWSPYNYTYNNSLRFVDPDGMQGLDWVKLNDRTVKWEANITTNAQAVAKYGEGATAIGKEVEYYAENGRTVALHDGGSWNYTDTQLPEVVIGGESASGNSSDSESGAMGGIHTALDIAGVLPGLGEIADGINAVIYAAQGDYTSAAISAAAMIPLAGIGATIGKLGNKVTRSSDVLGHIFRNSAGHVNPSTLASQERYINLFEDVSSSANNLNPKVLSQYQQTAGGFEGYSKTYRNGKQVWTQTRQGTIINAGVNDIPKY